MGFWDVVVLIVALGLFFSIPTALSRFTRKRIDEHARVDPRITRAVQQLESDVSDQGIHVTRSRKQEAIEIGLSPAPAPEPPPPDLAPVEEPAVAPQASLQQALSVAAPAPLSEAAHADKRAVTDEDAAGPAPRHAAIREDRPVVAPQSAPAAAAQPAPVAAPAAAAQPAPVAAPQSAPAVPAAAAQPAPAVAAQSSPAVPPAAPAAAPQARPDVPKIRHRAPVEDDPAQHEVKRLASALVDEMIAAAHRDALSDVELLQRKRQIAARREQPSEPAGDPA